MKKLTLITLGAIVSLGSAAKAVEVKPYISNKVTYANTNIDMKKSMSAGFDTGNYKLVIVGAGGVGNALDTNILNETGGFVGNVSANANAEANKWKIGDKIAVGAAIGSVRAELELGFSGTRSGSKETVLSLSGSLDEHWNGGDHTYGVLPGSLPKLAGTTDYSTATTTVMANVYYDFHNESKFTPYIAAGFGLANTKLETEFSFGTSGMEAFAKQDKTVQNFAWQAGVGVSYAINDKVSLDLGYSYSDFGKVKDNSAFGVRDVGFTIDETITLPGSLGTLDVDAAAEHINASIKTNYETHLASHEVHVGLRYAF
jgi:opacity protein-like surface antigen